MKISKLVGERLKEVPSGAVLKSHILLVRAGYIKQVSAGIFSLMPAGQRVSQKIQNIMREEMNAIGGQEVLMPVVMPREIWDMTGRYTSIGSELLRFKDRNSHDMLLGMTHEEASVHMALNTIKSHDQLPFMIYQIQTKYRDEARPRGGLIRAREFTMKDAYSFHLTQKDLENYYQKAYNSYVRIFKRLGMKNFISVRSDNGVMGGKVADEFMLVTENGEDRLVLCDHCGYKANMEVACGVKKKVQSSVSGEIEEVFTGNAKTIDEVSGYLNIEKTAIAKCVCYEDMEGKLVVAFIRADYDINENKLAKLCQSEIKITDTDKFGLVAGNIGPINLNLPSDAKIFFDTSLEKLESFTAGANKEDYHIKNVSASRDLKDVKFVDIALVKEGDLCTCCHEKLSLTRGIEIGNIFQLGTKYTQTMGMKVNMPDGTTSYPVMGCYGIGVGRALASVVEENCDEKGIIWPMTIAPWHVYFAPLRLDNENVSAIAEELYEKMQQNCIEVLYDDRKVSTGVKLTDSELMGLPIRVIISPKTIANGTAEVTMRSTGETSFIELSDLLDEIKEMIKEEIEVINSRCEE